MKTMLSSFQVLVLGLALSACAEDAAGDSFSPPPGSADTAEQVAFREQELVVCASAGAFALGTTKCCQTLIKDADNRCQYPTCKKAGQPSVTNANGISNCCFGLVSILGFCRAPTLSQAKCTILGGKPVTGAPCCVGLVLDSKGTCQRTTSVAQCSATQIGSCCYGTSVNKCQCYCPSPYFIGT